jgi:cell division septum initiation protein DivIVA
MVAALLLVPACEEQTLSEPQLEVKRARMRAADLQEDIKALKVQHAKELSEQDKQLDKCLKEKKALEDLSSKGVENYMNEFFEAAAKDAERMQAENNNLKAQLEQLQTENKGLREQVEKLKAAETAAPAPAP